MRISPDRQEELRFLLRACLLGLQENIEYLSGLKIISLAAIQQSRRDIRTIQRLLDDFESEFEKKV